MKKCPRCSARNADSNTRCSKCGCRLAGAAAASSKTAASVKPAVNKKGIAAVAAVVFLAAVLLIMMAMQSGIDRTVMQSAEGMLSEFSEASAESKILSAFTAALQEVKDTDAYRFMGHISSAEHELSCDVSCALALERMSGNVVYTDRIQGKTIPFEVYANDKEARLLAPMLTNEAYGFTFANLAKKKGISVEELAVYQPISLPATLESVAGKAWDAFLDSVEAEKFGERSIQCREEIIQCTVYKVSWDPEKARELISALTSRLVPGWVSGADPDCRCYLDEEGRMVSLDWVALGTKYTLVFEGADNIWREITLTADSLMRGKTVYTGGIGARDGEWSLRLANGSDVFLEFCVDEQTGKFAVTILNQCLISGVFVTEQKLVGVELAGHLDQLGEIQAALAFGPLVSSPQERDFKYTDLLNLSSAELQRLLIDVTG